MQALSLRERLFDRPFYRLCHGEGDFLPGLVLDRHGDWLTAQITTAGMERHREELAQILEDVLKPRGCVLANDIASRDLEGCPAGKSVCGEIWQTSRRKPGSRKTD